MTRREKGRQLRRPVPAPVTPADIPAAPLLGPRPLAQPPGQPIQRLPRLPLLTQRVSGLVPQLVISWSRRAPDKTPGARPRVSQPLHSLLPGPASSDAPARQRTGGNRKSRATEPGACVETAAGPARPGDPARPQGTRPRACETRARPATKGPFAVWTAEDRTLLASCPAYLSTCPALTSAASAPQRLAPMHRGAHTPRPPQAPPLGKGSSRRQVAAPRRTACSPRAWLRLC